MSRTVAHKPDELDAKILELLQRDARTSSREIAKRLRVATGTVSARINRLTEEGIIRGYTAILDGTKLGYEFTVITLIQVEGGHLVEVERELAKVEGVGSVYDITGEFDAAIIARFKDRAFLDAFIKSISATRYVRRTVTSVVLNVVKEELRIKA